MVANLIYNRMYSKSSVFIVCGLVVPVPLAFAMLMFFRRIFILFVMLGHLVFAAKRCRGTDEHSCDRNAQTSRLYSVRYLLV